jgi:hypothetical protein
MPADNVHSSSTRRLGDLEPIHPAGMNPITEHGLRQLSDEELIRTVTAPLDGQKVKTRPNSNRLLDGNTRVRELQRRMTDPNNTIKPDLLIPADEDL